MKTMLTLLLALCLSACAPLLGMMAGLPGPAAQPPQAPAQVTVASRTGIDFALNSFDAVLYGLDFAMDAKKIVPGSDRAKQLAALGRKVMGSLEVADSALKLGNAATYEDAFATANRPARAVQVALRPAGGAELRRRAAAGARPAAHPGAARGDPRPARARLGNHLRGDTDMAMFNGLLSTLGQAAAEMAARFLPGSGPAIEAAKALGSAFENVKRSTAAPRRPTPRRATMRCSPR
jgi:hypothetical protein